MFEAKIKMQYTQRLRIVYMGKHKKEAVEGLKFLASLPSVEILAVCTCGQPPGPGMPHCGVDLRKVANDLRITTCIHRQLYEAIDRSNLREIGSSTENELKNDWHNRQNRKTGEKGPLFLTNIDVVISFLFAYRIKKPLIDLPRLACINFHPGPLPEARGLGGYNWAILYRKTFYGVTAHYVAENFDEGDIIKDIRFDINADMETAFSLERKSCHQLLTLLKEVFGMILRQEELPRISQKAKSGWGGTEYVDKALFESTKCISSNDTHEEIQRKCRAFFYPPYPGAQIDIKGKKYTLVDEKLMKIIAGKYFSQLPPWSDSIHPCYLPMLEMESIGPSKALGSCKVIEVSEDSKLNIIHTNKGYFRSGEVHPVVGHGFVMKGMVEITRLDLTKRDAEPTVSLCKMGDSYDLPRFEAVIYRYMEDTVEGIWWEDAFACIYYRPYRTQVVARNVALKKSY